MLGDVELMRSFVVRHQCLDLILEALRENSNSNNSNRHLLVVGPRGIGKTMLVRRVAAEVRSNSDYGNVWLPIVFGEESYEVSSAGEFWLEALVHLFDDRKGSEWERTLDDLREERNEARLRERALAQLLDAADHDGKRLLLAVENLNMLCDQISAEAAWELRHTLMNEPRIMLLGTATSRFDAIANSDQAWFDLFAIHELKPLSRKESRTLWHSVAAQDLRPGQVRAMRILTGGNPRLLTVLAGFAANRSFRELMEQLVHLIDEHTEYFKGHLDSLPPKERKVFVGLLEHWNPVTTAELARKARLNVNEVSALLNRLVNRGAVEVVPKRSRRKSYQAAERLYNIYYLMRRRGQPADRVRAAVSFMVTFYGSRQLSATIADLAREACGLPAGKTEDHYFAYREILQRVPTDAFCRLVDRTPDEFFRRDDAPEFIRQLPRSAKLRSVFEKAHTAYVSKQWPAAEKALREATRIDPDDGDLWHLLGHTLGRLNRSDEAEHVFRKAIEIDPHSAHHWMALGVALRGLDRLDAAEAALRKATDLDPSEACPWHYLGRLLGELSRYEEAEHACLKSVEVDPEHGAAWSDLGIVLGKSERAGEAEEAFRRAIALNPKDVGAWNGLGNVLRELNRQEEAKSSYEKAIELGGDSADFWSNLGHLVTEVGPAVEAERVWTQALELHPILAICAVHLMDARFELGHPHHVLLREAEGWIEQADRVAGSLRSMARFAVWSKMSGGLAKARDWAREAWSKDQSAETAETLALVYAAAGQWEEALQASEPLLSAAADSAEIRENLTDFLIKVAAAGYAERVHETLSGSKSAMALEPLLVGLRIYLGETPEVAKEVFEIGKDVAERIREVAQEDKHSGDSESAPTSKRKSSKKTRATESQRPKKKKSRSKKGRG